MVQLYHVPYMFTAIVWIKTGRCSCFSTPNEQNVSYNLMTKVLFELIKYSIERKNKAAHPPNTSATERLCSRHCEPTAITCFKSVIAMTCVHIKHYHWWGENTGFTEVTLIISAWWAQYCVACSQRHRHCVTGNMDGFIQHCRSYQHRDESYIHQSGVN